MASNYSLNEGYEWIHNHPEEVYLQLVDAIKKAKKSNKRFDYACKSALNNNEWDLQFYPSDLNNERSKKGRGKLSIDAFHLDSCTGVEFQGPSIKERCYYHDFIKLCAAFRLGDIQAGVVIVKEGKNSFGDIISDFEGEKSFLKRCFEITEIPLCVLDFDAIAKGDF